jgi:hypothetical protein
MADAAAAEGHQLQAVTSLNAVLDYLALKQKKSIHLHAAIARRISRVAKEVLSRLEAMQKDEAKCKFIDAPPLPARPGPADGIELNFEALPPLPEDPAKRLAAIQLRTFWARVRICPCEPEQVGTTWLELFVLFSLLGGEASQALKAHLRQSHERLYKAFRKESKGLFRFADACSKPLLKAAIDRTCGPLAGGAAGPLGLMGSRSAFLPYLSNWPLAWKRMPNFSMPPFAAMGPKCPARLRCPIRLRLVLLNSPSLLLGST